AARPSSRPVLPRGRIAVAIAVVLALGLGGAASRLAVEALWFDEVDARSVFTTRLMLQSWTTIAGFVIAAAVLAFAVLRVLRRVPGLRFGRGGEIRIVPMDQRARPFVILAVGGVSALFAASLGTRWLDLRLALAAVPYGFVDPVFGRDVGDYVFV